MSYELTPRSFFSFPSIPMNLPSFWDDDDFMNMPGLANGVSISEDEKKVYIEASLPGIDPENIEVTFHDGYLWVRGEKENTEENKNRKYYRQALSAFSYRVAVPSEIDDSQEPEAKYKNGIMTVAFDKAKKTEPKKIPVKF